MCNSSLIPGFMSLCVLVLPPFGSFFRLPKVRLGEHFQHIMSDQVESQMLYLMENWKILFRGVWSGWLVGDLVIIGSFFLKNENFFFGGSKEGLFLSQGNLKILSFTFQSFTFSNINLIFFFFLILVCA